MELVRHVLETRRVPLLAICRGMQLLNVVLGGDLEQHLPDSPLANGVEHRAAEGKPACHDVRIEAGSPFEEIYGALDFPVCSRHHQGVRRIGDGLLPAATAPDGLPEALVFADHPFALAVQWHPESQLAEYPLQLRLFEALVARAR
jgi:gamma-glutamyl-gamma-aminobutyrate hydrolase PuuD